MTAGDTLSQWAERSINRYLALDEDLAKALAGLAGRVVALEVEGTGVHLACQFTASGVVVRPVEADAEPATAVDVHIRGTPLALLRLVRERDPFIRLAGTGKNCSRN